MDTRTSFLYDPMRQGYDTNLWKTLSGSVTTAEVVFMDTDSSDSDIDYVSESLTLSEDVTFATA